MILALFLSATILCFGAVYLSRSGTITQGSVKFSGFDGKGVIVGFIVYVAISALAGPQYALPFVTVLLLQELGQVMAYRWLGHHQVQYRLIPILNFNRPMDVPLRSDGEDFFVAIMGPALCLGPLAGAMVLSQTLQKIAPDAAHLFWTFAVTCGAINFLTLLPFWPLAGGRCIRTAVVNFWPSLAPAMTVFMTTLLFAASLRTGSVGLGVLAAIGAYSFWRGEANVRIPMAPDTGLIALAAYTFTLAAHFSAGWLLLQPYF